MKEEPKPYVTVPRQVASDFRNGKLTRSELNVYLWLRINANPYGVSITSLSNVREDIFPEQSDNYINKMLLKLKKNGYLYFEERKGRRGTFDVHFGDWLLPGGKIRHLEPKTAEVGQTLPVDIQNFNLEKDKMLKGFLVNNDEPQVRPSYNDTNTDTQPDKDNDYTWIKKSFEEIPMDSFVPNSHEEDICFQIARGLGDKSMNPILSVLREHGLDIIERAVALHKEDKRNGKKIVNKPAYFFGIVKNLIIQIKNGKQ